jgi:hypothetical protein
MRNVIASLAPLLLCAACSKAPPPSPAATAASGPFSDASARIDVTRFGVNAPRADGRACWTARYSVNLRDKTMHVETCVDDDPIARDVKLTDADVRTVRAALAGLRESSAGKCDASSTFLAQIYDDPRKQSDFVDSGNACHAGDMRTLDRGTLEAVFATFASIEPSTHV